jgi:hypothetical protein
MTKRRKRRTTVLGVPVGRRRATTHPVGRAAGMGVAGASVAAAGYASWSFLHALARVRRSVETVATTVEHGAKRLDETVLSGKQDPKAARAR